MFKRMRSKKCWEWQKAEEYPKNQGKGTSNPQFGALGTETNPRQSQRKKEDPTVSRCQPKDSKILEEDW